MSDSCEYCRDWDDDECTSDILTASIPLMPAITDVEINFELFLSTEIKRLSFMLMTVLMEGETYIPSAIFDDIDNMKEDGAE